MNCQHTLVDMDKVDQVVICTPPKHCECGYRLEVSNEFEKHQVFELPQPRYEVIEYLIVIANFVGLI